MTNKSAVPTSFLQVAKTLVEGDNREYTRGICEFLATLFPTTNVETTERTREIATILEVKDTEGLYQNRPVLTMQGRLESIEDNVWHLGHVTLRFKVVSPDDKLPITFCISQVSAEDYKVGTTYPITLG